MVLSVDASQDCPNGEEGLESIAHVCGCAIRLWECAFQEEHLEGDTQRESLGVRSPSLPPAVLAIEKFSVASKKLQDLNSLFWH